jgi:hypothetical protein
MLHDIMPSVVMTNVVILSVVMLNGIIPSVVILSVVMLNVMAPIDCTESFHSVNVACSYVDHLHEDHSSLKPHLHDH